MVDASSSAAAITITVAATAAAVLVTVTNFWLLNTQLNELRVLFLHICRSDSDNKLI